MAFDRKRPGVAFWATVLVVVALLLYVASFGPACWITSRLGIARARGMSIAYRPLTWGLADYVISDGVIIPKDTPLGILIRWYARLGAAGDSWDWRFRNTDHDWEWAPRKHFKWYPRRPRS
jgi:hypothetical protein